MGAYANVAVVVPFELQGWKNYRVTLDPYVMLKIG